MNTDLELAYLGLEVADPTAFGEFLADVVGLVPGEAHDGWRHHLAGRRPGPPPARHRGAGQRRLVRRVRSHLTGRVRACRRACPARRRRHHRGHRGERTARRVDELVRIETPWGVPVEIVLGLATAREPFDPGWCPAGS